MAGANRFAAAVSDLSEVKRRASAIPVKTKLTTNWGIRLWQDWAQQRETCDSDLDSSQSRALPSTPLLELSTQDLA